MPRRDVVLTGLIAFGAGVAVGVNWKKLGKEAAPLLEKLGLKMSDLADFLATMTEEKANSRAKSTKGTRRRSKKPPQGATDEVAQALSVVHRNGTSNGRPVSSGVKRKAPRSKAVTLA